MLVYLNASEYQLTCYLLCINRKQSADGFLFLYFIRIHRAKRGDKLFEVYISSTCINIRL